MDLPDALEQIQRKQGNGRSLSPWSSSSKCPMILCFEDKLTHICMSKMLPSCAFIDLAVGVI